MPEIKYDWPALKEEFLKGPWLSMNEFKRFKGLNMLSKEIKDKMMGWSEDKQNVKQRALKRATENLVEKDTNKVKSVIERQMEIGRLMQVKGLEALNFIKPELLSVEDARKLIASGLEHERAALGLGTTKGGMPTSLTQVNIKIPKTRLDTMTDGLNYTGLLKLIADLERHRTVRTQEGTIVEGPGKAQPGA